MGNYAQRARSFVGVNYPQAAFLGGSTASGQASASSDLDILVVLPDERSLASFVEATAFEGQLVEAFVYGLQGHQLWLDKGGAEARPVH